MMRRLTTRHRSLVSGQQKRARIRLPVAIIASALASVTVFLTVSVAARAADAPPTMILFDGSGSMWGKIEGDKRPKFEVAREAIRASLAAVAPTATYGLASFGHRRNSDCTDVQVVVPFSAGDPGRITGALDKLNPKGKGPIAGAIREIAKSFPGGSPGTVILVHDNADNCRQDPCEAINEVHAANPKLRFHLVSIALEPADRERMACIPGKTGGKTFDAADSPALTEAINKAIRVALIDPSGAPAPAKPDERPVEVPAAKLAAPPPPPPMPGLQLSARLGREAGAIDAPIRWIVRKGEAVVFEATGATPFAKLDPGAYTVEANTGLATIKVKADVSGATATAVVVPLEAAAVTIAVRDLKDGAVSTSAMVSVSKADDTSATRRPLWVGRASEASLILSAGAYKITASDGTVKREETLTAVAGAVLTKDIITGAGRLEITPSATTDGPPIAGVTVLLSRDDPDAPDGRREVARSAAPKPSFVLPAGTYYITAQTAAASVRERIAVGAGDNVKRTVSLGLAKVQVTPSGAFARASGGGPGRITLRTRVIALDGTPREVARSSALIPEFKLSPGKYRIEAHAGALNAKAQLDLELEPGAARKIALKLDAQTVTFKADGATDVTWDVRDAVGAAVARSLEAAPSLVLAPGRYQVRAEVRDKAVTGAFEVPAGADAQVLTVELSLR